MFSILNRIYGRSAGSVNEDQESDEFLDHGSTQKASRGNALYYTMWPWIAATHLFAFMLIICSVTFFRRSSWGTFERGFSNELPQAAGHIALHSVKFTGTLYYDADGTLHRSIDPDQPQYVGIPSPEIDANWESLVHNRYVVFPGSDMSLAPSLLSEAFHDPDRHGMYRIGIDVFHTLHCINMLRMAIDRDYYHDERLEGEYKSRLHIEHCLDYVRQMVMCKADLTPLPVYFSTGGNRTVPDFDRVHVCRDIGRLREWADHQTLSGLRLSPVSSERD